jgi:hypothetical protein
MVGALVVVGVPRYRTGGGTDEIPRGVIAGRVLGPPEEPGDPEVRRAGVQR